jgi:cytoskeletal protein CcmA (bactofilin family)
MFRKKDEDTQEELDVMDNTTDNNNQGNAGYRPGDASRAPVGRAPAPAAGAPSYRPGAQPSAAPATPATASDVRPAPVNAATKASSKRVLTVGNDILLKGEIATCDRLVIEGMVDATLKDVHTVEISGTGSFKGTAEIEDAEISGLFEGDLIVKNRLTIYSSGKVRGRISYGEIEIERGGQMTGEIKIGGQPFDKSNSDDKNKKAA